MKITCCKIMSMSELIENVRILKPELTDNEVLDYFMNMDYILDGIDPFIM